MKTIINKLFKNDTVYSVVLALCSALALTNKVESAYVLGICVLVVLVISNAIMMLIRKLIPDNVRIPVTLLIIGTLVTIVEIMFQTYIPDLYQTMGIYLPLIAINCFILINTILAPSQNKFGQGVLETIKIGLTYTFILFIIAVFREVLGSNTLTLMDGLSSITGYRAVYTVYPSFNLLPLSILKDPAGAFLLIGLLMGIIRFYLNKGSDYHGTN